VLMPDDYFGERMRNRQRLLWTVATRRQLERWEPIVARAVLEGFVRRQLSGAEIWSAQIEHHFALVAAGNLIDALELPPPMRIPIDPTLRAELIDGRNLHEHWREHLPVFNVSPRPEEPTLSGKSFAVRNPETNPFWWLRWNPKAGARLMPQASAPQLHELLDAIEAEVLGEDAALREYVPPRAPSPWLYENGEWWPKADDALTAPQRP
jgi:hypothetical protein